MSLAWPWSLPVPVLASWLRGGSPVADLECYPLQFPRPAEGYEARPMALWLV